MAVEGMLVCTSVFSTKNLIASLLRVQCYYIIKYRVIMRRLTAHIFNYIALSERRKLKSNTFSYSLVMD